MGKYMPVRLNKDDYRKEVQEAMQYSKLAVAVFDIIDFEVLLMMKYLMFLEKWTQS